MSMLHSVKMFMGRFIVTRGEIPEYSHIYEHVDNQGNIRDYLISVRESRPGIFTEV